MSKQFSENAVKPSISLLLFAALALIGCVSTGPGRPLTEQERAVKIMPANQDVSLQLTEKCKSAGKVETFNHMDSAKVRAIELSANTAQNIYTTNRNGLLFYDVRFWRCNWNIGK